LTSSLSNVWPSKFLIVPSGWIVRAWILRHYRDRVAPADLGDPEFFDENRRALSELSAILDVPIDLYE